MLLMVRMEFKCKQLLQREWLSKVAIAWMVTQSIAKQIALN